MTEDRSRFTGCLQTAEDEKLQVAQLQTMSGGNVRRNDATVFCDRERSPYGIGTRPIGMPVEHDRRKQTLTVGDLFQR